MNYRKKYCEYYKVELPTSWQVHHIDHNRKNNDIYNLIALPKFLHLSYHFYESYYKNNEIWRLSMMGALNKKSVLRMIMVAEQVNKCASFFMERKAFDIPVSKENLLTLYNEIKEVFDEE